MMNNGSSLDSITVGNVWSARLADRVGKQPTCRFSASCQVLSSAELPA